MTSVMLIDDDDDLREVLTVVISNSGVDVISFADARAALAALEGGLSPRLSLLDRMMPGRAGWDFREAQQRDQALARIPVVVVTAAPSLRDGERELTGVESLRKPFTLDAVLETINRHISADLNCFLAHYQLVCQ